MAISFIRIDDRIIHGQTVTRWANEYPCTGLIGVNDAAAGNKPHLKVQAQRRHSCGTKNILRKMQIKY